MEEAIVFAGEADRLIGILHGVAAPTGDKGVVVVVGGPQYRVGSHRHFVLLSRALAAAGIPVLRFDYRGMGDSDGPMASFEVIAPDIRAAVDTLCERQPWVRRVVLWGLCDAASAALMYAPSDPRVCALALLNPWVRSDAGEARAYLRHYYGRRLVDPGFWRKLMRGRWGWRRSLGELWTLVARARSPVRTGSRESGVGSSHFTDRMAAAWATFKGHVLLVLSGNDLTADEFRDWIAADSRRTEWLKRSTSRTHTVADANHTFARSDWRDEVTRVTFEWLRSW